MKRFVQSVISASACMALMLATESANAATQQNSWYFGGSGDLTWLRHSNTGGGGNLNLGYQFMPGDFGDFRLEGEAGYHGAGGSNGYSGTHYFTYMGNVYYDFNSAFSPSSSGWKIIPYIGGGLGDAEVHYGNSDFTTTLHHHDNDFAGQGMAGLTFVSASMPDTDWTLGYRYLGTNKDNLHSNNLEVGVRFHF